MDDMKPAIRKPTSVAVNQVVRVSLPHKLAYDLKAVQRIEKDILGRMGCPECHSGMDIRFEVIRDFVVDSKLNVKEAIGGIIVVEG